MQLLNCYLTFILAKRILQLFALFSDTLGLVDCHEFQRTMLYIFCNVLEIALDMFKILFDIKCTLTNFHNIFYLYILICPKNCISISCVCYYFYAQIIWSEHQSGTIYTTWRESITFLAKMNNFGEFSRNFNLFMRKLLPINYPQFLCSNLLKGTFKNLS